jgi:hypothetical protein
MAFAGTFYQIIFFRKNKNSLPMNKILDTSLNCVFVAKCFGVAMHLQYLYCKVQPKYCSAALRK